MIASLPIDRWPAADRMAWTAACVPSVRLQKGGCASHMKQVTRDDLARRYGYFLDHLSRNGRLDPDAPPAAHVTAELVQPFLEEVGPLWRPVTLAQSVYKIRRVAQILAPRRDFNWLSELEKDLALDAHPKSRFDRIVTSEQLVEAGLTLVREAELALRRNPIRRATQIRNGLMIALLAVCPIRIKNFAALELGTSLRREGDDWWIVLGARDTKSGRSDERPVLPELNRAMAVYLSWARPRLLGQDEVLIGAVPPGEPGRILCGRLWIGERGQPMTLSAVERAIPETTRAALGVRLSPHDFRRCGATTAALAAGAAPHLASALLQHRDRGVTDAHYNLATSVESAVAFSRVIGRMRA